MKILENRKLKRGNIYHMTVYTRERLKHVNRNCEFYSKLGLYVSINQHYLYNPSWRVIQTIKPTIWENMRDVTEGCGQEEHDCKRILGKFCYSFFLSFFLSFTYLPTYLPTHPPTYLSLSGHVTAVAVFRNPITIPFCLTTDLLLNVLFSWLLVHLPST